MNDLDDQTTHSATQHTSDRVFGQWIDLINGGS